MNMVARSLAALALLSAPAWAEVVCQPTPLMHHTIKHRFGETIQESLIRGPFQYHLWVNRETGSWTLTADRGGVACAQGGMAGSYKGQVLVDFFKGPSI